MAIAVVGLSRRGRYIWAMAFLTLVTIQSILGLVIMIWAICICRSVSPNLFTEQVEVNFLFTVIGIFGSHTLFHGLAGLKICHGCYKQSQKKTTRSALFMWILIGYNILTDIYMLATLSKSVSKHISNALSRSLESGMEYYLKDPYWKRTIDYIQSNFKCCGLSDYKTWHNVIWLDETQLKMDNALVEELKLSKTKPRFPVIPWSCCNIEYPLQCFHDPFQQTESSYLWKEEPTIIEESIYNRGCLKILTRPIENASTAFFIITCFLFIIMNSSIFIIRILYTSCRNNVILQHCTGIAPGWFFGRGDCGWSHGPTLDQIMAGVLTKPRVENVDDKDTSTKSKSSIKTREPKYDKMSNFSKMIHEKRKVQISKKQPKRYKSDEEPVSSGEEKALMLK